MSTYITFTIIVAVVYIILLVMLSDKYLKGGYLTRQDEYNSSKIAGALAIGLVISTGWFISIPILAIVGAGLILKKKYSKYVIEWYENTFLEDK